MSIYVNCKKGLSGKTKQKILKKDTLVLLKEENVSPMNWRRGRIEKAILGKDGKCRVVDVRTSNGISTRAIHNVCPFPTEEKIIEEETVDLKEKDVQNKNRKSYRIKNKNCLLTILSFLSILPSISTQNIFVEKFKDKSGILFESRGTVGLTKTSWDIIVHVNLNDYWHYKNTVDEAKAALQKVMRPADEFYYSDTIRQLEAKFIRIERRDKIILLNKSATFKKLRRSAPLSFMGSLMHALYGVMDEEHAEELSEKVERSYQNEKYLAELFKNQSSIEDMTVDVMRRQNEIIWNNFKLLNNSIYMFKVAINKNIDQNIMTNVVTSALVAMSSYEELQKDIIEMIWNSKGKFLENLLPLHKFQEQIKLIKTQLNQHLMLPDIDPIELAKIAKITTRTTEEMLIFEIKIPLMNKNNLQLYSVLTYPISHSEYFVKIQTTFKHIIIDDKKSMYYGLTDNNFDHCEKMKKLILCSQIHPLYNIGKDAECEIQLFINKKELSTDCALTILPRTNYLSQMHSENTWLFSIADKVSADIICDNQTSSVNLHEQGILRLKPNCHLKAGHVNIWAYNTYTTIADYRIPKMNLTQQLPVFEKLQIKGEMQTFKIGNIPRSRGLMGFPIDFEFHHLMHYTSNAGSWAIIIIIIIVIILIARKMWRISLTHIPNMIVLPRLA
uniref:DUF5641 domain-containing protein n=1 Tax=Ceratitis capitata TaxID=7213 RepID=W8AJR2_CERCA